jgi:PAS domain S-box-containing protein
MMRVPFPPTWLPGLRGRLVLLVLVAVLPAALLVVQTGLELRRIAARHAEDEVLILARLAAADQKRFTEGARQFLFGMSHAPALRAHGSPACNDFLVGFQTSSADYTVIAVVDLQGDVTCSSLPLAGPLNVADRGYVQEAIRTRRFAIGDFSIGRVSGKPSLNLAYPLIDDAGQLHAVLIAGLDLGWLSEFGPTAQLPAAASITVLDRHGTVLVRHPEPERWIGTSAADTPLMRAIVGQNGQGIIETVGLDQERRVYAFAPLGSGTVAIGLPTSVAYAEADRIVRQNLLAAGLVALVSLIAAWVGADVVVLRRLRALLTATEQLRAGDLGARTGLAATGGELGRLARAFDSMAVSLERRNQEREEADRALRESEAQHRRIVEAAREGIWEIDAHGRTTFVNPSMAQMLGTTVVEMRGAALFAFMDGEGRALAAAALGERAHGSTKRLEFRFRRPDGSHLWTIVSTTGSYDAAGRHLGDVALITDITERKQAEAERERLLESEQAALAELRATQQQVIQQERLRALGQMASGIAHDFNNALSPIVGYSELLLAQPEKLGDTDRITSFLEIIQTAAQDASGIVRRLREFYRPRDGDEVLGPVPLIDLIAQVISLTQFRWKDQARAHGAEIRIIVESGDTDLLPAVAGNPAELREALTNLIFNAVDAMPEGGLIAIRAELDVDDVVLVVRDRGMGMTEEVRRRCLEPFFTTKGEHGTGLGLGLVYGIVERHLGAMEIESTLGKGTAIRIRLPVWRAGMSEVDMPAATGAGRSLRVLVVEDEPLVRQAHAEYLSIDGHAVETAANGRAALAQLRTGHFDLVLTDRALPEMSGDHLAAAIKQEAPHLPVIMVTGFGDLMNYHAERPVGVDLILSKPLGLSTLRSAIAKVSAAPASGSLGNVRPATDTASTGAGTGDSLSDRRSASSMCSQKPLDGSSLADPGSLSR